MHKQNALFQYFSDTFDHLIDVDKKEGKYDMGILGEGCGLPGAGACGGWGSPEPGMALTVLPLSPLQPPNGGTVAVLG